MSMASPLASAFGGGLSLPSPEIKARKHEFTTPGSTTPGSVALSTFSGAHSAMQLASIMPANAAFLGAASIHSSLKHQSKNPNAIVQLKDDNTGVKVNMLAYERAEEARLAAEAAKEKAQSLMGSVSTLADGGEASVAGSASSKELLVA